jgi:transcription elongation factor S-II
MSIDLTQRNVKSDDVEFESTGNGPRDKTIELMYASVGLGSFAGKNNAIIQHF